MEKVGLDYGEEADMLYIGFGKSREAEDSVEVEDGVITIIGFRAGTL
jgi:uncharacterized protein YuzE